MIILQFFCVYFLPKQQIYYEAHHDDIRWLRHLVNRENEIS